ncbi:MAG: hypothetical protein LBC80_05440 [Treponema sp.]|jgi:hypothetical protein|nr:hypothetical protein [Treponema sp.]
MKVNGCECSIVIKTAYKEMSVPYSEETIREAFSVLQEDASIEGDGSCKAIRKASGVTGCVVTPLTIGSAPLLLYLAMGAVGNPVYVSETRGVYQYQLNLLPMEDTEHFDLVQERGNERKLFEGCRVIGFELRIEREQAVKLKIDIYGDRPAVTYSYTDNFVTETGERFNGDSVTYKINGKEYKNIYGLTLVSKKQGGTKTELWIRRSLEIADGIPEVIEEIVITAQLLRDKYEHRYFGTFRITMNRLVFVSDETNVNTSGAVIGPLRYYVAGTVLTEVFTSGEERLA